jgi:TolB-like protein
MIQAGKRPDAFFWTFFIVRKTNMKKNKFFVMGLPLIATAVVMAMAACATKVPIKSVRKPTIDTTGIQRLAVKPFENASGVGGTVGAQLPQYLTDKATQIITATGKFTLVAPSDPNADGVFTGKITNISSKDSQVQNQRKDKSGKTYIETTYTREVFVEFSYSVISTRTDMPIGTVLKQGSDSSSTANPNQLADTLALAKRIVDSQMNGLEKDIVPYIVSTDRELMDETSKDEVVNEKMDAALELVKNGNYEEAIRQYDAIASEHGSVAARTNAGILRESLASDASASAELAKLFNDKDGLVSKAIKSARDMLNSKLPPKANITIMKTSSTERGMLDDVVDQLTRAIVEEKNLTIVDRSNQSLIAAEQQFQMSGLVSDDSIISLGHQLGVQYMVVCKISGEKSGRRLNVRVLNVETAQITAQNDFEI